MHMSEIFCDIVPHPEGWMFVSEGVQSPIFPCYQMAVEAAYRHANEKAHARRFLVLRQQDLKGRMCSLAGHDGITPSEDEARTALH